MLATSSIELTYTRPTALRLTNMVLAISAPVCSFLVYANRINDLTSSQLSLIFLGILYVLVLPSFLKHKHSLEPT